MFDDVVVSLGPIEPSEDALIVPTYNNIEKKSGDLTTVQSKWMRENDTLFGLPSTYKSNGFLLAC